MTEPQQENTSQDTERQEADTAEETLNRQVSNGDKPLSEDIDSEPGKKVVDSKPKLIGSESMPQQNSSEAEIVSKKSDENSKNADIEKNVDESQQKFKESELASQENAKEFESGPQANTTSVAKSSQETLREGEIDSKEINKDVEVLAQGKIGTDKNVFSPPVRKEDNTISLEKVKGSDVASLEMTKDDKSVSQEHIQDDDLNSQRMEEEDKEVSQGQIKNAEIDPQEMAKDDKSVSKEHIKDDDLNSQRMTEEDKEVSQKQIKNAEIDPPEVAKDREAVSKEQIENGAGIFEIKTEDTEVMNTVADFISWEMAGDHEIALKKSHLENNIEAAEEMITHGAKVSQEMNKDDEIDSQKTVKVNEIVFHEKMDEEQEKLLNEEITEDGNLKIKVKNYVENIIESAATVFLSGDSSGLEQLDFELGDKGTAQPTSGETVSKPKRKKKKAKSIDTLPPLILYRPAKFEADTTQKTYLPYPPLAQLPFYPKLAFPKKWGAPLSLAEPRTVLVGFTCPPAPKFRQDQLMTHAASTLRRYYSKPCIKTVEWIKVPGKN